jgi:predicted AlkP superfamily pyrophosphatase or phosphodiesterase
VLDPVLLHGARVVVLVVLDGYGALDRRRHAARLGAVPGNQFAAAELTSVFPSTTTAALTSIQTGAAPSQHGLLGYTLYLPSLARVVNMLFFRPVDGGTLAAGSLDPASFLAVPTLYQQLQRGGVDSVVVSHAEYEQSPLTLLQSGGVPYAGHRTLGEFTGQLLREIERPGRRFVFGYWAGIDMLAHRHGPASRECEAERALVDRALRDWVLAPLAAGGDDVALMVTADHGLASVPWQRARTLNQLTADAGGWARPPTGERRALGLSLRGETTPQWLAGQVAPDGVVLSVDDALRAGLYGPLPGHPDARARIGDVLLLARDEASFPSVGANDDLSRISPGAHGSLTPQEMLVPLLVWRFG